MTSESHGTKGWGGRYRKRECRAIYVSIETATAAFNEGERARPHTLLTADVTVAYDFCREGRAGRLGAPADTTLVAAVVLAAPPHGAAPSGCALPPVTVVFVVAAAAALPAAVLCFTVCRRWLWSWYDILVLIAAIVLCSATEMRCRQ